MSFDIRVGDALDQLRAMPDESVHCVVTSPPYWGLRDYGVDGQIGLELSFAAFLDRLVAVFAEVQRVLRPDGTLWINMGDSYAGAAGGYQGKNGARADRRFTAPSIEKRAAGIKTKDMLGVPWRLAFALRDAGWYLRSEIIWHKPNPMPESVYDRPTRAHEHLFLLTRSAKYWYDHKAIATPIRPKTLTVKTTPTREGDTGTAGGRVNAWMRANGGRKHPSHANKRTVWSISSRAFKGAHFATFPEKLVEPCVLAGCPHGGVVLDPFMGSGTTGVVAIRHGRRFLGIELNPAYAELARGRLGNVQTVLTGLAS